MWNRVIVDYQLYKYFKKGLNVQKKYRNNPDQMGKNYQSKPDMLPQIVQAKHLRSTEIGGGRG